VFVAVWSPARLSPSVEDCEMTLTSSRCNAVGVAVARDVVSASCAICWSPFCAAVCVVFAALAESETEVLRFAWAPERFSPSTFGWMLAFWGDS
jgi:hypothetical protein